MKPEIQAAIAGLKIPAKILPVLEKGLETILAGGANAAQLRDFAEDFAAATAEPVDSDQGAAFDNRRKAPPDPTAKARELASAGNALVHWFNANEISIADSRKVMSLVLAKIVADTTRLDVFALSEQIDIIATGVANDINNRLFQKRSDIRLGKRKPGGSDV